MLTKVDLNSFRLKEVLMCADDIEPDVPKVWRYMGELVGPVLSSSALSLSLLKDSIKLVDYKASKLLSELLNVVVETKVCRKII